MFAEPMYKCPQNLHVHLLCLVFLVLNLYGSDVALHPVIPSTFHSNYTCKCLYVLALSLATTRLPETAVEKEAWPKQLGCLKALVA